MVGAGGAGRMLERVVPSQVVAGGEALRSLAGGGRWARLASPAPTPALHPTAPQTSVNHPSFCTKPPLTNSCRWRQVSRDSKKQNLRQASKSVASPATVKKA